jgi:hypothetical protein
LTMVRSVSDARGASGPFPMGLGAISCCIVEVITRKCSMSHNVGAMAFRVNGFML